MIKSPAKKVSAKTVRADVSALWDSIAGLTPAQTIHYLTAAGARASVKLCVNTKLPVFSLHGDDRAEDCEALVVNALLIYRDTGSPVARTAAQDFFGYFTAFAKTAPEYKRFVRQELALKNWQ